MLALGIFADGTYGGVRGLITGSGWQLLAQLIGVVVAMAWALGCGAILFYILKATMGLRVSELIEHEGVDVHLHGSPCYPAQDDIATSSLGAVEEIEEVHKEMAILEEALSRDARREKIYSEKLGRWIYAEPKK
jgi:Amt family ammonium transporter